MSEFEGGDRDPLEMLAAEFIQRQRKGQHPSLSEFTARCPELASEIEELFPAIAAMERLKAQRGSQGGVATLGGARLERLGDFRILAEIGRGGMGIVYEAFQESLGRHVAVKVLPRQALLDPRHLQRFQRESQTAARLHHTNIVPVFGVGEQDGFHYIVMQLIRGVGLDAILAQLQEARPSGPSLQGRAPEPAPSGTSQEAIRLAGMLVQGPLEPSRDSGSSWIDVPRGAAVAATPATRSGSGSDSRATVGSARAASDTPGASDTPVPDPTTGPMAGPVQPEPVPAPGPAVWQFGAAYWRNVAGIGLQVADALQYAHTHHTLHRDIKPSNLLLDAQGVVWISDFGLAKAMEQNDVTRTGALVGTPRYMAPEQFSGQVDARSDVYSLGLTLYELITLRPAFDDANRGSLIRKISHEEPVRPRKIHPSIPRDLETIVLKAMASDPARRYPTAGELARDLQRFLEDRPIEARRASPVERLWRWSRRNPLVAGLMTTTVGLLVLVAVVASAGYVQTTRANVEEARQRKKAEDTSALALEALDNIFQQFAPDRVPSSSTLTVVGSSGEELAVPVQPVLSNEAAALLEHLLAFYDRLAAQGGDDSRVRRKVAEANRRVGDIRQRLGDYDRSKEAYLRAIEMYGQLASGSSEDADIRTQVARIHNELGNLYSATNEPQSARKAYQEALASLDAVPEATKQTPSYQFELARTYYYLGKRAGPSLLAFDGPRGLRHGPPGMNGPRGPMGFGGPRGPDDFGRTRDSRKPEPDTPRGDKAVNDSPGPDQGPQGPRTLEELREMVDRMDDYRMPFGEDFMGPPHGIDRLDGPPDDMGPPFAMEEPSQREEYLRKAIALLERLTLKNPAVPDYRLLLARCYCEQQSSPFDRDSEQASQTVSKATAILQKLVEEHPDVPDYRYALSETYAMQDFRGSPARDPESARAPELASSEADRGEGHKPGQAKPAGPGNAELTSGPRKPGPHRAEGRRFEPRHQLEREADRRQREEQSRAILGKALAVSEELVAEHPNIPEYAASQVFIRLRLARLQSDTDATAAAANLRKAQELQASLVRRYPEMSSYKFTMSLIQESLADLAEDQGQLAEERSLLEGSIATLQEVLRADSTERPVQGILSHHYERLSEVLRKMGQTKAAEEAMAKSRELRHNDDRRGGMPPFGGPDAWRPHRTNP